MFQQIFLGAIQLRGCKNIWGALHPNAPVVSGLAWPKGIFHKDSAFLASRCISTYWNDARLKACCQMTWRHKRQRYNCSHTHQTWSKWLWLVDLSPSLFAVSANFSSQEGQITSSRAKQLSYVEFRECSLCTKHYDKVRKRMPKSPCASMLNKRLKAKDRSKVLMNVREFRSSFVFGVIVRVERFALHVAETGFNRFVVLGVSVGAHCQRIFSNVFTRILCNDTHWNYPARLLRTNGQWTYEFVLCLQLILFE